MTDNRSSSQESLPLSQETYNFLLQGLLDDPLPNFISDEDNKDSITTEAYLMRATKKLCTSVQMPIAATTQHTQPLAISSSLPATVNWPGYYMFTISFNSQEQTSKSNWCFSNNQNKLYVRMDKPCPINFSTNTVMPGDFRIRAMAMFSAAGDMTNPVKRCVNHSMQAISNGVFEAEHLIRCNSNLAVYDENPVTKRHSVSVPFENPPEGQSFSSYIFNFTCFTSCAGGPNRRPMKLIFTLERGNEVFGRQILDLRICACPFRDMNSNSPRSSTSDNASGTSGETSVARKRPVENSQASGIKKKKYSVETENRECYEFLMQMKQAYFVYKTVSAYENIDKGITIRYSTSGSSSED